MALTPESKNSVTMNPLTKPGAGWDYDDAYLTYDGATDTEGRAVLYDGIGSSTTLTPESKNSATMTASITKNAV